MMTTDTSVFPLFVPHDQIFEETHSYSSSLFPVLEIYYIEKIHTVNFFGCFVFSRLVYDLKTDLGEHLLF